MKSENDVIARYIDEMSKKELREELETIRWRNDYLEEMTAIENLLRKVPTVFVLREIREAIKIERENHIIKEYFLYNKTMPEIAENEHLSVSRIREIKENGLNRLRNGKARRIILEKFDIAECSIYRNGIGKFNDHNHTSTVEYIAMRRAELREEYEKRLRECLEYVPRKWCKRNGLNKYYGAP